MPGMGKVALPGHDQQARGPGVHQPGGRPAPLVLLLRGRALVPPGRQDRPRLRHGLLGHGDGERQQREAGQGVPQGSPQARRQAHAAREALPRRARGPLQGRAPTTRPASRTISLGLETIVQEFPGDIDARAWLAMVTWQNGDAIGSRQAVDTVHRLGPAGRADAPRRPPLPHPPLGRRQAGPRREVGRALRQDRPRDRPRLAHARPHLHRPEALRRRRLPAGRLGPGRPRLHDPRPRHAVRDPQLRPQQPVARHQPEPHRPGPRRDRRRPEPGRAAPRPEQERQERRRLAPAQRAAPLGRGPDPLRALGRPDRRHRLRRPRLVRHPARADARRPTPWAWPTPPRATRRSSPSRSPPSRRWPRSEVAQGGKRRPRRSADRRPSRSWKATSSSPRATSAPPSSSSPRRPRCAPRRWPAPT